MPCATNDQTPSGDDSPVLYPICASAIVPRASALTWKSAPTIEPSGVFSQIATFSPGWKPNALKKNTSPGWPACGSTCAFLLGGSTGRTSEGPPDGGAGLGLIGPDGGASGASGGVSSGGANWRPSRLSCTRWPDARSGQYSKRARSKYWTVCTCPSASCSSTSSLIGKPKIFSPPLVCHVSRKPYWTICSV